ANEVAVALEAAMVELDTAGSGLSWRRTLHVAAAVVAALGSAAAISSSARHFEQVEAVPRGVAASPRIAVLPFRVLGAPRLQWLGEGMVDLLASGLDAGGAQTVNASAVVRRARDGVDDLSASREMARALGADLIVVGTVIQSGNELRLHARVHAVEGSETTLT